jgi:hypothetical protein
LTQATKELLDSSKASALSPKLGLRGIWAIGLRATGHDQPQGPSPSLNYNANQKTAFWNVVDDTVVCLFHLDVTIAQVISAKESKPLATFEVTFRAEYGMKDSFDRVADAELLDHYVGIVGRLHVWPYMRAEIQDLSSKLGLPALTLPVLMSGDMAAVPASKFNRELLAKMAAGQDAPALPAPAARRKKAPKRPAKKA